MPLDVSIDVDIASHKLIWEISINVHVCATCNIDDGKVRYQPCSDDYIAEHAYVYIVQIKHTM